MAVTGANRHDVIQLERVLDAVIALAPEGIDCFLYADRGYDGEPASRPSNERGYTPRVHREKRKPDRPPKNRRWIVEVPYSWFNRFRKILVR